MDLEFLKEDKTIDFESFKYLGNIKNLNDILIWLWVIAIARAVFSLAIIIFSKFK